MGASPLFFLEFEEGGMWKLNQAWIALPDYVVGIPLATALNDTDKTVFEISCRSDLWVKQVSVQEPGTGHTDDSRRKVTVKFVTRFRENLVNAEARNCESLLAFIRYLLKQPPKGAPK
jgi:hypothetical protein